MTNKSSRSDVVRSIGERPETPADVELDQLAERARTGAESLGWGGSFAEGRTTSGETITCSERDAIASVRERIEHLIDLVTEAGPIPISGHGGADNDPDIAKITQFLDSYLQRTGKEYLTPPEANRLLAKAGLLRDRPSRPGSPLRELLRREAIPHAYQPSGKGGRWLIPHSSSKRNSREGGPPNNSLEWTR